MKSTQKQRRLSPRLKPRASEWRVERPRPSHVHVTELRFDERQRRFDKCPRPSHVTELRIDERPRRFYERPYSSHVSERKFNEGRRLSPVQERKVERPLRASRSETAGPSHADSSTPRKPARDRVDHCQVSGCFTDITRVHAATHLPGIFDDHLEPTEELLRRRISVLRVVYWGQSTTLQD